MTQAVGTQRPRSWLQAPMGPHPGEPGGCTSGCSWLEGAPDAAVFAGVLLKELSSSFQSSPGKSRAASRHTSPS